MPPSSPRQRRSRNGLSQPACVSSAVAVSSVYDPSDIISSFSNMHAMVELMAPGQGIISSYPDDTYLSLSGTSMSAPHVAGAWALLKQLQPAATVDAILNAFTATGVPIVTRSAAA
ncbi:MAG: S8 family serine peptidase [Caldilineaceae bacterium]